jgi:hypothetical protein
MDGGVTIKAMGVPLTKVWRVTTGATQHDGLAFSKRTDNETKFCRFWKKDQKNMAWAL